MLRPILEEKELIGRPIRAAELAKICRNHHRRLPVKIRRALELAYELKSNYRDSSVLFEGLEISVYMNVDHETQRLSPEIEFRLEVSLEQQSLNQLAERKAAQSKEQLI